MDIFLTIFAIFTVFLIALVLTSLFAKLRLKLRIDKKCGEKLSYKIAIEVAGGIIKKNLDSSENKHKRKQASTKATDKTDRNDTPLKEKIRSYYETTKKIIYVFSRTRHKIRKNILIEKLSLNIEYGLDDAAKTGIATGTLWSAVYFIIGFLSAISKMNEPQISINPDFQNEKLAFDGECIIVLRLANIINILFIIGITYLSLVRKIKNKEKAAINYGSN